MEKTTLTKKTKLISIACIIAIILAMYCQFVSGWNFSGTITNPNTRETRAMDMEMSVSSFVWQPYTEEATAFKNYIKDPSLKISEEIVVNKDISAEEYDGVGMVLGYEDTKEKYNVDGNDVVIATYELDDASTRQVVLDSSYNHDEAVAEAEAKAAEEAAEEAESEEAVEEETEATEDTEAAEETEAAASEEETEAVDPNAVTNNSNMMIAISESHIDPIGNSQNTVLSKSADKEAALAEYEAYANSIGTASKDQAEFINGIVIMPALLLVFGLLAIVLIILGMRKGKGTLFASIATFLIGLLNLIFFYTQPIFLLFQADSFATVDIILSLVTILGFVLTVNSFDYKSISKGILKFAKNKTFVALISGVVLTVIAYVVSSIFVVGTIVADNSLSLILSLVILAYGVLTFLKAIIAGARDNAHAKRASK